MYIWVDNTKNVMWVQISKYYCSPAFVTSENVGNILAEKYRLGKGDSEAFSRF